MAAGALIYLYKIRLFYELGVVFKYYVGRKGKPESFVVKVFFGKIIRFQFDGSKYKAFISCADAAAQGAQYFRMVLVWRKHTQVTENKWCKPECNHRPGTKKFRFHFCRR